MKWLIMFINTRCIQIIKEENRNLKLNILNLSRAAEISCDRIGFLSCGDLEVSLRAILKLASGLNDQHLNFKFSAYLNQLRELETLGKVSHNCGVHIQVF